MKQISVEQASTFLIIGAILFVVGLAITITSIDSSGDMTVFYGAMGLGAIILLSGSLQMIVALSQKRKRENQ